MLEKETKWPIEQRAYYPQSYTVFQWLADRLCERLDRKLDFNPCGLWEARTFALYRTHCFAGLSPPATSLLPTSSWPAICHGANNLSATWRLLTPSSVPKFFPTATSERFFHFDIPHVTLTINHQSVLFRERTSFSSLLCPSPSW